MNVLLWGFSCCFAFSAVVGPPSDSARMLANLYEAPVSAPPSIGRPHAVMFKPKGDTMEQNVGDHVIT